MFFKESVLKKFQKILRKTPVLKSLLNKPEGIFIKKETPTKVFSCKFFDIFKNTFFTEHFTKTSSFSNSSHSFILRKIFIYLLKPSFVRKIDKNSQFCHIFISIFWMYFIDQNINTRNYVSLIIVEMYFKIKCRTVITNIKKSMTHEIARQK